MIGISQHTHTHPSCTIVLFTVALLSEQFDELTVHPKWEQRLKDNRAEYGELLTTLLSPISQHFCSIVMMMENTVA